MKKLYATKYHLYSIIAASIFVASIMGYAYLTGDAPLFVPVMTLSLMVFMIALTWLSYKGKLPIMKIED